MDCERVAEILPWLLNGTLEPALAEAVGAHLRLCRACRQELAGARQVWEVNATHLPAAALVAFALEGDRRPGGLERGEVEAHLEACGSCRAELALVLEDAGDGAGDGERVLPFPPAGPERAGSGARRMALAAGLTAVVVGAFAVGRWQSPRPFAGSVSQPPAADLPLLELRPAGHVERGATSARAPLAASAALLLLTTDDVTPFEGYRLEVHDAAGTLLWRTDDVVRQLEGDFALHLPAGAFPSGELEIRLIGRSGPEWRLVERYTLNLVADQHEARPVPRVP